MLYKDDLKGELHRFCELVVSKKLETIQNSLKDVQEGLTSETKSTAGDKHETGRAMLQIEREKIGERLRQAENMQKILRSIDPNETSERIGLGSLVHTTNNNFYIATPSGCFTLGQDEIYCISVKSPIGILLLGKQKGDFFEFNGVKSSILKVK
ncbi:3-oxoacyl-ACP synthase [Eudoraea chungangensis]|uniref:3-oxoacyl-ACP synthase n=1 Tax=Eudoraea chungangensis TaxID=1481905 RepID=UPI0023ED8517|nr:3-oxoacyl-ACP synthase [Eudoraea chungangensis]